jgi:hypothetical protein
MVRTSHRRLLALRGRARAWIDRYLPAEIGCTTAALVCAGLASESGVGAEAIAAAGTLGEVAAFYAVMVARELLQRGGRAALPGVLRDLALEFGPAELLDSLLLRPALLYAGIRLAPHPALGALLGKLAADVAFYSAATLGHELARRGASAPAALPRIAGVSPQ